MNQPPIHLWGIQISEPTTTITDLMVAGVCFYGYYQLNKVKGPSKALWFVKYYLLMLCISTTLGGILGHAFQHAVAFEWKLPGWLFGMYALLFMERASIEQARSLLTPQQGRLLTIFNFVEIFVFTVIVFWTLNFIFVGIHSVFALLLVVFPLQIFIYRKTQNAASMDFIKGVGWSFVAYIVFLSKAAPHPFFNALDMAHIFMAIAAWQFYQGGRKLI